MSAPAPHISVLPHETLLALAPLSDATVLDGTFGWGGHSAAVLDADASVTIIALDRDPLAQPRAEELAARFPGRFRFLPGCFGGLDAVLADAGVAQVDAVLLDIGVSSMQLDTPARGFSFQADGPLDMRMSQAGRTAADLVNTADEAELTRILADYGEEPRARRVAKAIITARALAPITTTGALAEIVRKALGGRQGPKDPATRTFQALRIAVNEELDELRSGLEAAERVLGPGGRLAVITFHSLEDRIVKHFLRTRSGGEAAPSRHAPLPVRTGPAPSFEAVAKPVRAGDAELAANPRARSATLRAARRTSAPAWSRQMETVS
jgi:16S rRNA (cytosine1402-N4)-methyltransferase